MISILLIGVSLSMDAFAVSVTNGLTLKGFRPAHALWMGLYFGFFQFLMPLIGCLLGSTVSGYISAVGPYISFALLAFIGGKMLLDSLRGGGEDDAGMLLLSHKRLLALAVATSIDALAVGVSFAFMDVKLLPSCTLIGCTTFTISVAGAFLGRAIPNVSGKKAGIAGGLVLVGIGVKLLLEGIGVIG
ncbi:MAG: manganese efflux pump MntP family protein [Butyricicoccus sp.]|nr:manganese efflux pump MntP family protein [Butyricicoccus sp.]